MDVTEAARWHFVGIGGYGMSGLAQVLHQMGEVVTGSDARTSDRTARLEEAGVPVRLGHDPQNLGRATVVVYSTDVPADNPELAAARERGLQLLHRSEVLARLLNPRYGIAVTGTHGKTTTTSMISVILQRAGLEPTCLIGGELEAIGGTGRLGHGEYVVAEADESDGSFLRYTPQVAVVTNVEPEHLEHYGRDFGRVLDAYERFLGQVKPGGLIVLCGDDPRLRAMAPRQANPTVTYGLGEGNDLRLEDFQRQGGLSRYQVLNRGASLGEFQLSIPGRHMALNSLAALAVGMRLGLAPAVLFDALKGFGNAKRRFQVLGEAGGIRVIDDYAHHPTEIDATLRAARDEARGRVAVVFQPQRYTRTHILMPEFARAFSQSDLLILTEIYSPPGEPSIPGVSSAALARMIEAREGRPVELITDQESIVRRLLELARPGDTVITMGAGDIWKVAREFLERLMSR